MKIVEIKIFRVDLPLAIPFLHFSSGQIDTLQEVVAAVSTDTDVVGYGEVRGNSPYLTGDTPDRAVAAASYIARLLIGESLDGFPSLIRRTQEAIVGNSGAKALLDIALHDAYAKALGIPVTTLLGGRMRNSLPSDVSIAFAAPEKAASEACTVVGEGYTVIKVRVGMGSESDKARLTAVRDTIDEEKPKGHEVILAADANGAWTAKEAVALLRQWEHFRLGFIEQPVPGEDIAGLRFVRENSGIPVMADESAHGPKEILRLIESQAVDLIHFKACKAGGLFPLRTMMALAEAAGISYMMGQTSEGMLATAAAVHAGAASRAKYFEVNSDRRIASQPFCGLALRGGSVTVPHGPGLGIEVDEEALRCVAVIR